MKQYNYIYKITNLTNGKIYIGKHSTDNLDDGYLGSGKRLKYAIRKYGIENFEKEIIAFCYTEDELNRQERFYIRDFNSMDSSVGYNLTKGGDGVSGLLRTEETKLKMRGKIRTEDYKQKMSDLKKGHIVSKETKKKISESHKGKTFSEETRKKISESKKGRTSNRKGVTLTEETRLKMSIARKLYCEKRKKEAI